MKLTQSTCLACFGLSIMAIANPAFCQAPDIGSFKNFDDYLSALNKSTDPEAATTRAEIAGGPADLAQQKDNCNKRHIPLSYVKPVVPDGQDAYPVYLKWNEARTGQNVVFPDFADSLTLKHSYTSDQLAQVQKLIDNNPKVFDLLHQAAGMPYFLPDPNDTSNRTAIREAAREIRTQSYLLASKGSFSDAIAMQSLGLNEAKQASQRKTIISYLVAAAVERISMQGLQDIMSMAGPDQKTDAQVRDAVNKYLPGTSLKECLTGEISWSINDFEGMRNGSMYDIRATVDPSLNTPTPQPTQAVVVSPDEHRFVGNFCDELEARYIEREAVLADAAGAAPEQRRAIFAGLQAQASQPSRDPVVAISNAFSLDYEKISQRMDAMTAVEQVTLAAAQILSTKAQTGLYPVSLPAGFTDPFTGKALGYTSSATGFVVYSVGTTGKYDGTVDNDAEVFYRYPPTAPTPIPKN